MERTMGIKLTSEAGKPLHVLASSSRQPALRGRASNGTREALANGVVQVALLGGENKGDPE
jgi:hypothetical protein